MPAWPWSKITLPIAVFLCIAVSWIVTQPYFYARAFYSPSLIGRNSEDAIRQVGKPDRIPEGDIWIYQPGMSPRAIVEFREGRVINVWTAHRDGFQKP